MSLDPLTFIFVILGIAILVIVLRQVLGPPNIPSEWRWIIWLIVAVLILAVVFHLLGFRL